MNFVSSCATSFFYFLFSFVFFPEKKIIDRTRLWSISITDTRQHRNEETTTTHTTARVIFFGFLRFPHYLFFFLFFFPLFSLFWATKTRRPSSSRAERSMNLVLTARHLFLTNNIREDKGFSLVFFIRQSCPKKRHVYDLNLSFGLDRHAPFFLLCVFSLIVRDPKENVWPVSSSLVLLLLD